MGSGHYSRRSMLNARLSRTGTVALLCLAALLLSLAGGCRKEPSGPIDPDYRAPFILAGGVTTARINLDTSGVAVVTPNGDGTYAIVDSLTATIIDPSDAANIRSCTYRIKAPGATQSFQRGSLSIRDAAGNIAHAAARIAFSLRRDEVGIYVVEITATGADENVSNTMIAGIAITRNNARPRIFSLSAPDTLVRPASGVQIVRIAVTANDSDGTADIEKVFFKSVNSSSPDFEQPMFDDGLLSVDGDSVANDGRFSRLIPLDSTATPGTKEFRFWARDRAGALSDSLIHFIVIKP